MNRCHRAGLMADKGDFAVAVVKWMGFWVLSRRFVSAVRGRRGHAGALSEFRARMIVESVSDEAVRDGLEIG